MRMVNVNTVCYYYTDKINERLNMLVITLPGSPDSLSIKQETWFSSVEN